ncbi:hypothetical protein [Duganella violaceipulchra]|uniref:Uncharacterized protein n=1 Tax=Duganella violaceipulchra TaxID=2849652 RepID=A0AA41L596_9BURK|nr:hypothetical protein [Duganella violaceicalia]MBV6321957.1 hypothetical protein [Duganella violaceicalia]MCP2007048.1 hypothetical protein [Duganella violaceicalia]
MKQDAQERAEVCAGYVVQLSTSIFQRRRAAVIAGDKDATRDLSNGLLEELANNGQLAALLIAAFTSSAELTGLAFRDAVLAVARRQADEEAEAQVVAAQRAASADPEQCRARNRRQMIAVEWMRGGA